MVKYTECFLTIDIEHSGKFCKLAVTSALGDMNDLTVFPINRNSQQYDVLALQVHRYQTLHKTFNK